MQTTDHTQIIPEKVYIHKNRSVNKHQRLTNWFDNSLYCWDNDSVPLELSTAPQSESDHDIMQEIRHAPDVEM